MNAYLKSLTPEQSAQIEADAIAQASEQTRQNLANPEMRHFKKAILSRLVHEHVEQRMVAGTLPTLPA